MHSNCRLLPEDIVCKITQRNNIRRANTCDPALKLLNEEITSDIQKHKQNIWKEHLDGHWDHRHNTHTLWKTIHGLSNKAPQHTLNTSITFNNKIATTPTHIANCFTKQFTNTVKHATHKTNRHINRHITLQRLPPARGGTAQRKILHLANWSQLIHPGPASSMTKFFLCRVNHACQRCLIRHPRCYYLDTGNFE